MVGNSNLKQNKNKLKQSKYDLTHICHGAGREGIILKMADGKEMS